MKIIKKINIMGILFILPALILFLLFTLYPLVTTIGISFFSWDGFEPEKIFVGFQNYTQVLHDEVFWLGVRNVVIFALSAFIIMNPVALILAALVSTNIKGSKYFKIIYYLPVMLSGIVVGLIWKWLFNGDYGIINNVLHLIGIQGPDWLNDGNSAIAAIAIASVWQGIGCSFILFWAAIQGIPLDYYESADLDGASFLKKLWYITIPSIKSMMSVVIILTAVGAAGTYQIVASLTNGGPAGKTTVPIMYIYDMINKYGNYGYATAMSSVLGGILLIFSLLRLFAERRGEKADGN